MSQARFGFAAHPEALADLRAVPDHIRDLALLELQHLVHGLERGAPLSHGLIGCYKLYIDPAAEWRAVVRYRDAPAGALHSREIYLVAVGARDRGAVYDTALARLRRAQLADHSADVRRARRAQAARSRSPLVRTAPTAPDPTRSAPPPSTAYRPAASRKASA